MRYLADLIEFERELEFDPKVLKELGTFGGLSVEASNGVEGVNCVVEFPGDGFDCKIFLWSRVWTFPIESDC